MDATTINVINDVISNLGFPIAMVAYFIWDKTKITNQLTQAITNNNAILQRLLDRLDSNDLADKVGGME